MARTYMSFKELLESGQVQFHRDIEVVVHNDENIANNRLFVWNFEEVDLEEFLDYFRVYKDSSINSTSRQVLGGNLMRKMNNMLREGYNPVECMLYASKTINSKLMNDRTLQEMLAERIKDIYIKKEEETQAVLMNIMDMWTWDPQINVVITTIGLIGDNQELLDKMMVNYAEDSTFKTKVFYALLQNKSQENLERLLKIIMNLQDSEEDMILGRAFTNEFSGFGYEGGKMLSKYYESPGISGNGARVLRKIMLKEGTIADNKQDDDFYRNSLATKSAKDDISFKDFVADCYDRYDNQAFYISRFSRPEIGSFLKDVLEDGKVSKNDRDTAITSLGIIGLKGYSQAKTILDLCEEHGGNDNAVIVSKIFMGEVQYAQKLVDIMCRKKDYELSDLYRILRMSTIVKFSGAVSLVQAALEVRFRKLVEEGEHEQLDCLSSNLQMFWDKKLYALISRTLLDDMQELLLLYAKNRVTVPYVIIVSLIETVVQSWSDSVEKVMFALYQNSDNQKVQQVAFNKLKNRRIEAPM